MNKQKGFSLIEVALGLCMMLLLLIGSLLLVKPAKDSTKLKGQEQNVVIKNISNGSTQPVEKDSPVLEGNSIKISH